MPESARDKKGVEKEDDKTSEIVVSGMSGKFPESSNVHEFEENLFNGVDMITDDGRRWSPGLEYDFDFEGMPTRSGKLKELDKFDALYFGVHGKQAHFMDPQLRLLHELTHEAIVDAGVNPSTLRGTRTGVFIGASLSESEWMLAADPDNTKGYDLLGCTRSMFANRLSFTFDLRGPSVCVDTACSSSLLALEQAVSAIRRGECDAAIVGGVHLCLSPFSSLKFHRLGMLSLEGKCKSFDAGSNGYVRSEAAVIIFVQKKDVALRSYASILHIKTSTDGYKDKGVTFPAGPRQAELLEKIYEEAKVDPREVVYVEAHGTGTPVGDPQELNAVSQVFCKEGRDPAKPLLVGSVKSNMGHSEPASGLCSVVKVLISMQRGELPGNLHFTSPNPNIPALTEGRIQVVAKPTPFKGGLVGINSFGFGGCNVHAIFQPNQKKNPGNLSENLPILAPYSGRTPENVEYGLKNLSSTNNERSKLDHERISLLHELTSQGDFPGHPCRGFALFAPTDGKLLALEKRETTHTKGETPPVWFIFSGMGSQYEGMGRSLMALPIFADSILKSISTLQNHPQGVDLTQFFIPGEKEPNNFLDNIVNSFVSIVAIQIALVDLLSALGIHPSGIIGHSVGELAASYADGCFTAEQTIVAALLRGRSTEKGTKGSLPGAMAALGLTWEEAKKKCPPGIYPACHNSIDSVTVSGPLTQIQEFVEKLQVEGIFARQVNSAGLAFHSKYIEAAGPIFKKALEELLPVPKPRSSRWVSSSVAQSQWDSDLAQFSSPAYHVNNVVSPVLFQEALEQVPKNAVVIEIGPHCLLQSVLKRALPECGHVNLINKNVPEHVLYLMQAVGKLYNLGLSPDFRKFYRKVEFPLSIKASSLSPLIKWDHSNSWKVANWDEQVDSTRSAGETIVEISLKKEACEFYSGHKIDGRLVFPATGYLCLVWSAFAKLQGQKNMEEVPVVLEQVKILQAALLPENGTPIKFTIRIFKETGEFQIGEDGNVNACGIVRSPCGNEFVPLASLSPPGQEGETPEAQSPVKSDVPSIPMNNRDAYKELRLRGYEYSGPFQGIQQFQLSSNETGSGSSAEVEFNGNWISFLDTILQVLILSKSTSTRALYLPTYLDKIVVDPNAFLEFLRIKQPSTPLEEKISSSSGKNAGENEEDKEEEILVNVFTTDMDEETPRKIVPVSFYENLQIISCEGVQFQRCAASMAPRRDQNPPATTLKYEKRVFTPYFDDEKSYESLDKSGCLRTCIDIVLENCQETRIQTTEFLSSDRPEDSLICEIQDLIFDEPSKSCVGNLVSIPSSSTSCPTKDCDSSSNPESDSGLESGNESDQDSNKDKDEGHENDPENDQEEKLLKKIEEFGINFKHAEDLQQSQNFVQEAKQDDLIVFSGDVNPEIMEDAADSMKPGAFLLVHRVLSGSAGQNVDTSEDLVKKLEKFQVVWVAHKISTEGHFYLFKKDQSIQLDNSSEIKDIFIKIDLESEEDALRNMDNPGEIQPNDFNYSWIIPLQEAMERARNSSEESFRIFIVSMENPSSRPSGIIGLLNSLRHERGGEKLRCIIILQGGDEKKNLENWGGFNSIQKSAGEIGLGQVLHRDLVMNVFDEELQTWGSFRFFPIPKSSGDKIVDHAYINVMSRGDLSSLRWFESPLKFHKEPAEICQVYYAPLNFRDVMLASGKLPLDSLPNNLGLRENVLGLEFSGKMPCGKRVMGLVAAEALATSVIPVKESLYAVPDHWTLAEAATVPVCYSTAFYALIVRGKIQPRESILIHSGAGGVGQAAIQIALSLKCIVYTTVGSLEKRKFLQSRFPQLKDSSFANSRDTSFLQHIMKVTEGRGVDLVLNSLAADKLQASVKCLAQHGRFLEIGKLDLFQNSSLGLSILLKNVSVHGILLDSLVSGDADQKMVYQLMNEGIESGVVRPLEFTTFGDSNEDVEKAFRFMASGKHIGKVLIEIRKEHEIEPEIESSTKVQDQVQQKIVKAFPRTYFDPAKSYIVVGGLGGVGIELSEWMIQRGASKLVLVSRSGVDNGYKSMCIRRFQQHYGAKVVTSSIDVTTDEGVENLFNLTTKSFPGSRIGGIFNLAMVLSDGLFEAQSAQSFRMVSRPKINTSMALDKVSRRMNLDLDFFVLFSSAYSSRGDSCGLSNYAWANGAMENICVERQKVGLNALAIQWGPIGDVGVLQESTLHVGNEHFVGGMKPQRISSCLNSLDILLHESTASKLPILTSLVMPQRGRAGADSTDSSSGEEGGQSLMERVAHILGMKIEDIKNMSPSTKLTEVGMDSLMAVEIRQLIEMRAGQQLSSMEILNLTFGQIQEIVDKMGAKKVKSQSSKPPSSKKTSKTNKAEKLPEPESQNVELENKERRRNPSTVQNFGQRSRSRSSVDLGVNHQSFFTTTRTTIKETLYYSWGALLLLLGGFFWVVSLALRKLTQFYINKWRDPSTIKLMSRPYDAMFAINASDSNIAMTMKCSGVPCKSKMLRTMNDRMFKRKTSLNLDAGKGDSTTVQAQTAEEYEPYELLRWRLSQGLFFYYWKKDEDFNPGNHLKFDYLPAGADLDVEARRVSEFYHGYKWQDSDRENDGKSKQRRKFSPQWEFRVLIPTFPVNQPKDEKEFLVVFAIHHSYGDALCILHLLQYVRDIFVPRSSSVASSKRASEEKPAEKSTTPSTPQNSSTLDQTIQLFGKTLTATRALASRSHLQIIEISRMLQISQAGIDHKNPGNKPRKSAKQTGVAKFRLSQLKSIRQHSDDQPVTMATVVLTCASYAFEKIFASSSLDNEKKSRLRKHFIAQMPYTVRPYHKLGFVNNLATSFTPIPVKSDKGQRLNSWQRLEAISHSVEDCSDKERLDISWQINSILSSLTRQMQIFLQPRLPRAFFIYSNVPASIPRDYTFFGGYKIKSFFGDAMLIGDTVAALSSVVDSDQDSVALSLVIDERALEISPHFRPQFFAYFQEELTNLIKSQDVKA